MPDPSPAHAARRVLPLVYLTVFLDLIGFGLIIPLLPFYVESMGGSGKTVGLLLSCFALSQLLATPLWGRLSDRFGRRPVILISLGGNVLAMLIFAYATNAQMLWLLYVSRILAGGTAGNFSACQAAIADITNDETRTTAMGRMGAAISMGLILGPLLGGLVSDLGAWAPPVLAAALAAADWIAVLFLLPETRPGTGRESRRDTSPRRSARAPGFWHHVASWPVLSILVMTFLMFLCISCINVALALFAKLNFGWGPRQVGYLYGLFGVITFIVSSSLVGPVARRFGAARLVAGAGLLVAVGMLFIAGMTVAAATIGGMALLSAGIGFGNPTLSSMAAECAHEGARGALLGIAQSSSGLGRAVGPSLWGFAYEQVAPSAPFYGSAIAAALLMLIAFTRQRQIAKGAAELGSVIPPSA